MVKSLSISIEDREKMDHLTVRSTATEDMKSYVVLTVGVSSIVVESKELIDALSDLNLFQKEEVPFSPIKYPERVFTSNMVDEAGSLFPMKAD
jgi:hypothetical protein